MKYTFPVNRIQSKKEILFMSGEAEDVKKIIPVALALVIVAVAAILLAPKGTQKPPEEPANQTADDVRAAVIDDFNGTVKAKQNENELDAFKGLALLRDNALGTGAESWSRLELDEGRFAIV